MMLDSHGDPRLYFFGLLGTKLRFSTGNHLQNDGQMERINVLLEEYLSYYVSTSQNN